MEHSQDFVVPQGLDAMAAKVVVNTGETEVSDRQVCVGFVEEDGHEVIVVLPVRGAQLLRRQLFGAIEAAKSMTRELPEIRLGFPAEEEDSDG